MRLRVAALAAVMVMSGAAAAAAAPRAEAASAAPCAPRAGELQVAVVVDLGTEPDSPGGVSSVCVPVSERSNGAAVLAARADQLGTSPPRYASSGLLCAIDGYPASGCGDRTGSHYRFWSYWLGTGSGWSYAGIGPAGHRADTDVVEGWRFVDAAPNPSAPQPRGLSDSSAICRPAPPATDPVPPTNGGPDPTTPTATSSAPPGPDGGPSNTAAAGTAAPAPDDAGPGAKTTAPTTAAPPPSTTGVTEPGSTTPTTSTTAPPPTTAPNGAGPGDGAAPGTTQAVDPAAVAGESEARVKDAKGSSAPTGTVDALQVDRGGRPATGLFVAGAVAVALVGAGIWQARRRRPG